MAQKATTASLFASEALSDVTFLRDWDFGFFLLHRVLRMNAARILLIMATYKFPLKLQTDSFVQQKWVSNQGRQKGQKRK